MKTFNFVCLILLCISTNLYPMQHLKKFKHKITNFFNPESPTKTVTKAVSQPVDRNVEKKEQLTQAQSQTQDAISKESIQKEQLPQAQSQEQDTVSKEKGKQPTQVKPQKKHRQPQHP